jgi:hypothetical protein
VTFLPMAVETCFWNEKRPELLISFGQPLPAAMLTSFAKQRRLPVLEERLEHAMDELRDASMARDPLKFDALVEGRSQINAVYDAWRRLTAFATGQRFQPGHGSDAT